jgi:hypothetical protein
MRRVVREVKFVEAKHGVSATVAVVLVLILAGALPAVSHEVSRFDGNDVSGPLDIKRLTYDHRSSGARTVLIVAFHEKVTKRDLRAPHRYAAWLLDTFGDSTLDFQVNVTARRRNDRLRLVCERIDKKKNGTVRFPGILDGRKVSCDIPSKVVGGVAEGFSGGSIYNNKIKDLVPNNNSTIKH